MTVWNVRTERSRRDDTADQRDALAWSRTLATIMDTYQRRPVTIYPLKIEQVLLAGLQIIHVQRAVTFFPSITSPV